MAGQFVNVDVELSGGDMKSVAFPKGTTFGEAKGSGQLASAGANAFWVVNGGAADDTHLLEDGDVLSLLPKSGKQG